MPKGYWIGRVDVSDFEKYRRYIVANASPLARFGARFLVRAGRFENPDGSSRARNVVIEFPSYQAALDCWRSAESTPSCIVYSSIQHRRRLLPSGVRRRESADVS